MLRDVEVKDTLQLIIPFLIKDLAFFAFMMTSNFSLYELVSFTHLLILLDNGPVSLRIKLQYFLFCCFLFLCFLCWFLALAFGFLEFGSLIVNDITHVKTKILTCFLPYSVKYFLILTSKLCSTSHPFSLSSFFYFYFSWNSFSFSSFSAFKSIRF